MSQRYKIILTYIHSALKNVRASAENRPCAPSARTTHRLAARQDTAAPHSGMRTASDWPSSLHCGAWIAYIQAHMARPWAAVTDGRPAHSHGVCQYVIFIYLVPCVGMK